ncbi:OsmC family protein [Phenylobacterium sp.]|uniref:OsmC family protein n=1 Tax=Phenylobacterium sp. TaxID=1871053 RepID=UPI0025DFE815|nr:OsmC family protein [Phenylobacterium sp.]
MTVATHLGRRSYLNGVPIHDLRALIDSVRRRPARALTRWRVSNSWRSRLRSSGQVDVFSVGGRTQRRPFEIEVDQPSELGGTDNFANPQEYLLAALNACLTFRFATLCALEGLEIHRLDVSTEGDIDLRGLLGVDPAVAPGYAGLETTVRVKGSAPDEAFRRIFDAMLATSPTLHTITQPIAVRPRLVVTG